MHDVPANGRKRGLLLACLGALNCLVVRDRPRQPEVEDLDAPGVVDHHVVGLEVAVNDPLSVGRHDCPGQLDRDRELLSEVESLFDDVGEPRPTDQLERQDVRLVPLDVLEDLTDVRVCDLGEDSGLPQKPRFRLRVEPVLGADRLERDLPFELLVVADVHLPHPTPAKEVQKRKRPTLVPIRLPMPSLPRRVAVRKAARYSRASSNTNEVQGRSALDRPRKSSGTGSRLLERAVERPFSSERPAKRPKSRHSRAWPENDKGSGSALSRLDEPSSQAEQRTFNPFSAPNCLRMYGLSRGSRAALKLPPYAPIGCQPPLSLHPHSPPQLPLHPYTGSDGVSACSG